MHSKATEIIVPINANLLTLVLWKIPANPKQKPKKLAGIPMIDGTARKIAVRNPNKSSANLAIIANKAIIERIIDTFPNVDSNFRSIDKKRVLSLYVRSTVNHDNQL